MFTFSPYLHLAIQGAHSTADTRRSNRKPWFSHEMDLLLRAALPALKRLRYRAEHQVPVDATPPVEERFPCSFGVADHGRAQLAGKQLLWALKAKLEPDVVGW